MSSNRDIGYGKRTQWIPACLPRTRREDRELFAEIIEDRRSHPRLLLCVIQKHGSPEILFLGQFRTLVEAETAAGDFMSDFQALEHAHLHPQQSRKRKQVE